MKKITRRAFSVLLIAALIIGGIVVYVLSYVDHGKDWALYFSRANSGTTGTVTDRNGLLLASFSAADNLFAPDELTRVANYHVTGDYWGRSGTGILASYWNDMQGYSLVTGTTEAKTVNMQLNIDAKLNNKAYEALNGRKGAVLIVNYRTGELLAMCSTPAIDPADPEAEPEDGAYINRCLSAAFVPGSVFKLITAAAAIENIPNLDEKQFYCEGVTEIAGVEIKCSGDHYTQTFEQALANSCNVAFARIAVMLGQDTLIRYVKGFGFLDPHDLDGIPTAAGSFPLEFVGDPETAWAGIGQSTDMICPYSLLRLVSAIANGGVLCEPKLIRDGQDSLRSRFLEASTADKLKQLMAYNVTAHYGGEDSFPGLRLCAKTGTAELGDGTSHAWFAGFLDDETHPYAFVVFVEQGGGGLSVGGKLANTILQYAVTQ